MRTLSFQFKITTNRHCLGPPHLMLWANLGFSHDVPHVLVPYVIRHPQPECNTGSFTIKRLVEKSLPSSSCQLYWKYRCLWRVVVEDLSDKIECAWTRQRMTSQRSRASYEYSGGLEYPDRSRDSLKLQWIIWREIPVASHGLPFLLWLQEFLYFFTSLIEYGDELGNCRNLHSRSWESVPGLEAILLLPMLRRSKEASHAWWKFNSSKA